jgi:hypothetical protein
MKIKDLFERDIFRPINGVVKADQKDASSVWQELDEFVITRELDGHFRKFIDWYLDTVDKRRDPKFAGKMGIWISGFFGSGKSHLLKVFSYLLANQDHAYEGQSKKAVEFFQPKVKDAMLFADLQRAMVGDTDVILFNIDAKADHRNSRDLILRVFLKVLNELQGYSGDHPHIAHLERHLESKGKLEAFKATYYKLTGLDWAKDRDAYQFNRDEVVKAFMETLGQSQASSEKWIDGAEDHFAITVENFCKWTKEYLESKGPSHRIVFLVDEVGQFIGNDSKLMLNLQTIVEGLGTTCNQRAWVIVTAQEDMDSVLNDMSKTKKDDFSRIQGRFFPPLKLSSANVDEVIQSRLIAKVPTVKGELTGVFRKQGDILKNQLTFKNCKMTFKSFIDDDDFSKNYPFSPYQFQLIQKVFEAIRKAGATGANLARGERSMLDAFQAAGKTASSHDIGVLVPLYDFYPSIESFLDTAVKKTIDQAETIPKLQPFDIKLLQVLFLIRYVEEMTGNVDNLVTLCLDKIDCDRLALRRSIEESLARLESESLINRNGDIYSFLTNEERDINREIKLIELANGEDSKLLGDLLFSDLFKDAKKHRYSVNHMDFEFNREIDLFPHGQQKQDLLKLAVISPLADDYERYEKSKCLLDSATNGGYVLIRLGNDDLLGKEIRTYLQTEKYISRKNDGTLPESTKRILKDCSEDNRHRRERLVLHLGTMLAESEFFVAGQSLKLKTSNPVGALGDAFEYLIQNTFTKMGLIKRLLPEPLKELQAILRSNDIGKENQLFLAGENNPDAIADLRSYFDLFHLKSQQLVLHDLLEKRSLRPYGWPNEEVLVLLARLMVLGEIQLVTEGAPLPLNNAYEAMINATKRRKIVIRRKQVADPTILQNARALGKELFAEMGPDGEEPLTEFLQNRLREWQSSLNQFKGQAEDGSYPGKEEIAECLLVVNKLMGDTDSCKFIERFNTLKKDLLDIRDQFADLNDFYTNIKPTWKKLGLAYQSFKLNQSALEKVEASQTGLRRMKEILEARSPYSMLREVEGLITKVGAVNQQLVDNAKTKALETIGKRLANLATAMATISLPEKLMQTIQNPLERLKNPLENLKKQTEQEKSLAHITQAQIESEPLYDEAIRSMEETVRLKLEESKRDPEVPVVVPVKQHHVIKPSVLNKAPIETTEQMEAFLAELRQLMQQALSNNKRIEIR